MTAPQPLSLGSMCTGYGGMDLAVAAVLDVAPAWVADPDPGAAAPAALLTRLTTDHPLTEGRAA